MTYRTIEKRSSRTPSRVKRGSYFVPASPYYYRIAFDEWRQEAVAEGYLHLGFVGTQCTCRRQHPPDVDILYCYATENTRDLMLEDLTLLSMLSESCTCGARQRELTAARDRNMPEGVEVH